MKVFISWSGDRSKKVAELLDEWLQCVIQAVDPWMSSKDIDRGALWFNEISDQLADTSIGIVCLTKENKNKPWILFESGALAKGLSSQRVCTFLIDLLATDVENPLAQFNHTFPNKESMWELVRTINLSLKELCLKEVTLSKVFETYWPQFKSEFNAIVANTPETEIIVKRKDNEIMLEMLSTIRTLDKRMRSIEINSEMSNTNKIEKDFRKDRMSPPILRSNIKSLCDQDAPDELIFDILCRESNLPKQIIAQEIARYRRMKNNNVDDKNDCA